MVLVVAKSNCGYSRVYLSSKQGASFATVHRLVASAFILNPASKPHVNHINGIKSDNKVENLEWCTPKENSRHAVNTGLQKKEKGLINERNGRSLKVAQYSLNGELIKVWPSAREAGRHGFDSSRVSACRIGIIKTSKGFIWRYIDRGFNNQKITV